jgi:hypothetical protein
VCACPDGGFGPRPRHVDRSFASAGCTTRSHGHRPVKGGGPSEVAKGVEYFPQAGNNLWKTPVTERVRPVRIASGPGFGRARGRCRFIDGRHLGCSGPRSSSRKSGRCGPGPACVRASDTRHACGLRLRRKAYGGELLPVVLRKQGRPGVRELLPFAGAGVHVVGSSAGEAPSEPRLAKRRPLQPAVPRSHDKRCPGGSGWGSALRFQLPKGSFCEGSAGSASRRPLARETSAGGRLFLYRWSGASASRHGPKTGRCCPCSVQGLGWSARLRRSCSTGTLGGKMAKGPRPFRRGADAGERGERSAQAHVSFVLSHPTRGSDGTAVVLAG